MRTLLARGIAVLAACLGACWGPGTAPQSCESARAAQSEGPAPSSTMTVGVVQTALEPDLAANRNKMLRFVRQAKEKGCRVVVFPETALYSPPATTRAERDPAIDALRKAAADHGVYVIFCVKYSRDDKERPFERLLVLDPQGKIIHSYDKLWADARFTNAPGLFSIDGVPCAAAICADRWIRAVEDLPAVTGAKILFECFTRRKRCRKRTRTSAVSPRRRTRR